MLIRLLAALLVLSAPARAADIAYPETADAVPGAPGTAWLDLVRQVFPDYGDAGGAKMMPLRHIGGADYATEPVTAYGRASLSVVAIRIDGKPRHALMIDPEETADSVEPLAVLALFDDAPAPKLLDAAQVAFDRLVFFEEPASLALSDGDDLIITGSGHFNAGQGYGMQALILPRGDRLELVDLVWTFDETGCGYSWTQIPSFTAGDRGDRRYADIVATIAETVSHDDTQQCDGLERPAEMQRSITVTYRWDDAAQHFKADSDAFDRLAAENEQRF
ncbi:MAG: hypothetical protein KF849_02815 [Rhizobiaceae bacterium]|nr:hypothetical protein [Rhizobiaceae bacterium]